MYNGTCEGTNQEARPCNNMKALQQDIATLQRKNKELQEENRKLKEKLDTMDQKSTKGVINSHISQGPHFSFKFDIAVKPTS